MAACAFDVPAPPRVARAPRRGTRCDLCGVHFRLERSPRSRSRSAWALAEEAIWLARVLASQVRDEPEVLGLLSLMLHLEARRPARRDRAGRFVPLDEQDVSLWRRDLMALESRSSITRRQRSQAPKPLSTRSCDPIRARDARLERRSRLGRDRAALSGAFRTHWLTGRASPTQPQPSHAATDRSAALRSPMTSRCSIPRSTSISPIGRYVQIYARVSAAAKRREWRMTKQLSARMIALSSLFLKQRRDAL